MHTKLSICKKSYFVHKMLVNTIMNEAIAAALVFLKHLKNQAF